MKVPLKHWPRLILVAIAVTLMSLLLISFFVICAFFTKHPAPNYHLSRIWSRVVAWACGVTWSLHNADKAVKGQSYIICPNHQSHTDILALLLGLPTPYRWVIKKELINIPVFGMGLARTGAIVLDRTNKAKAFRILKEEAHKASGGWSVLIYPEGTRSADGHIQKFKRGAFIMAVNTGVPILPVTVNGAAKILRKGTLVIRPGHITITLCDPIPTEGLTEDDIPQLMEKTRSAIEEHFDFDYNPFAKENRSLAKNPERLQNHAVAAEKS